MFGTPNRTQAWLSWAQSPRDQGGLGLAPHQAAGLVGNLVNESGGDLNPWGPTGDNGTAWGTAQWRGDRLARLKARPDYQTMEGQQAFMREEMDGPEAKAYAALQSAKSPEEAARAVNALYERSADTTGGRERSARSLMDQFGGGAPDTGALSYAATDTGNKMAGPALSPEALMAPGALNSDQPQPGIFGYAMPDNVYDGLMGVASSLAGISDPEQAKSLMAQAAANRKTKSTWSTQVLPNGQILRSNSNGGMQVVGKAGDYSKDDTFIPVHYTDPNTGQVVLKVLNKNTGQFADGGGQGAPAAPTMGGDPALAGQDRYNSLTPDEQRTIDGWHEGTGINPSSYVTKNPRIKALMDAAQAVYPDMDFTKYGERQNFVKGYGNKSPIAFGGQIIGTDHTANLIGQVADTMLGLQNSSGSVGGYGATAANMYKDATGGNERANLQAGLKKQSSTLSQEFQTLMSRGKGGGQGEREEQTNEINQPHAAPEVQVAALQKMLDALKARHEEYVNSAKAAGGDSWVARHPDVDANVRKTIDETQAKLDKLYNLNKGKTSAAPAAGGLSWADAQKAGWK